MPANLEYLLERTDPLNATESIEACTLALKQGQHDLVRSWLGEPGKLACTEEMGDAIKPFDSELALAVYLRAQAPHKVIRCFAETGQFDKIVHHSQTIGYQEEDYLYLLQSMLSGDTSQQGVKLAEKLLSIKDKSGKHVVGALSVVDVFVKANLNEACLRFLMEYLQPNDKAQGALQTRFFELYFAHDAAAAKQLLVSKKLTHYDRKRIAQLCEKYGYARTAIEHYQTITDIKRVFSESMSELLEVDSDWIQEFLSSLKVNDAISCLESALTISGIDHDYRVSIARLVCELYREKFFKRDIVEAINQLGLNREILHLCESNGWHSERIQFLLRLQNAQLWSAMLTSGISNSRHFIDEVASFAVECGRNLDPITCLIRALANASLSTDLMALVEALLFESNIESKMLENYLLMTAIKLAQNSNVESRVMDYAMRLHKYDANSVAEAAEANYLFEEAFAIYEKHRNFKSAMRILLDKIKDVERARRFAQECDDPSVWEMLPPEKEKSTALPSRLNRTSSYDEDERPITVIENKSDSPPPSHPLNELITPKKPPSSFYEEILLPELAVNSPAVVVMKNKKKLPPIGAKVDSHRRSNDGASQQPGMQQQLADLASQMRIKKNARHVLQMDSDDVQRWLIEIGLGQYCDRFVRYNGQMLDNLYSLHFTAPEFFCQSVSSKLDGELDNVILFFGGLCKLYGDDR